MIIRCFSILKNIDLKIGEDLLIIGNSGIGKKQTLLHLLAGLLKADSGSINIYGQELKNFSNYQLDQFRRENIGIVFSKTSFY